MIKLIKYNINLYISERHYIGETYTAYIANPIEFDPAQNRFYLDFLNQKICIGEVVTTPNEAQKKMFDECLEFWLQELKKRLKLEVKALNPINKLNKETENLINQIEKILYVQPELFF